MTYTNDEILKILGNHKAVGEKCVEIIKLTSKSYTPEKRNAELSFLAAGVAVVMLREIGILISPELTTYIKESIVSAYLLGKMDASIPSAFEEFDNGE